MQTLLAAGAVFANDYRIVRPLNQGGMGAVYIVEQISTGKQRALKLMHPQLVSDPELRRRFEQEARVGSHIASEHVVEVHAAGIDAPSGMPYLVMELLEGEDLASRIKRSPLSVAELAQVFEQLCHAMTAAHAAGIIHRDLKPENIFLAVARRAGGPAFTVKVLDFGIAKLAAEAGTHGTTGAMGSPLWMAPEQTDRGTVTPAADVWAMGLIAYNALTGTHFWKTANDRDGTVAQLMREIVLEPIPPASQRASEKGTVLPPGFEAWFSRCVSREPAQRFGHAAEMWHALSSVLDPLGATAMGAPPSSAPITPAVQSPIIVRGGPPTPRSPEIVAATPPPMTTTQAPVQSSRWILATSILAGLLIAVIGIGIGLYFMSKKPVDQPPVVASAPTMTAVPSASEAPTASASIAPSASAPAVDTSVAKPIPKPTTTTTKVATPTISTEDENGPNGSMNNHTWKLKNGEHVRVIGAIVKNSSNVADPIVRKAVEWSAWQYNRCYDASYGQLPAAQLPTGTVVVGFDILDQLPRHGSVDKSDFSDPAMGKCVQNTLIGQTINAAGPNGTGHVVYSFKFVPN